MRKPKILLVHNFYQLSGGEDTVVENEKKILEENGHVVVLYTRHNSELKKYNFFRKIFLPFTTVFSVKTFIEIRKVIKQENIDIVHVHNTLTLISPSVYYAAISMNTPVVQTIHNFRLLCPAATFYYENKKNEGQICIDCIKKGLKCSIKRKCYRGSFLQTLICVINLKVHRLFGIYNHVNYIFLTEFNEKIFLDFKNNGKKIISPEKVFIKPNFTFDYTNNDTKEDTITSDYYIYIGRIEKIKGIYLLIKAFEKLNKKLVIVGSGNEFENIKQYINEKDLSNIIMVGQLSRKELNEILKKAKAIVVPSQWYETFGMIIIEAYSNFIPAIVGDIGNISNLVEENRTGLKFKYDSWESLVDVINQYEKIEVNNMKKQAYIEFKNKFTPQQNYLILQNIYSKILQNNKGS